MYSKQQAGFTLIELAVVVFLIGLLASVGLSALNAQLASSHISDTKKKQEIIKDALVSYLGKYKRLPCPAIAAEIPTTSSGKESRVIANTPANCTNFFGIIPYTELGLPKSVALDGYENFFSYAVTSKWTLTLSSTAPVAGGTSTNNTGMAFSVTTPGEFIVNDRIPVTYAVSQLSPSAVVLVISHGKNGLGAFTSKGTQNVLPDGATNSDELANTIVPAWVSTAPFYKREYTDISVPTFGTFDDIILFLNPSDLITPLTKDGSLKSAEALWINQVANINSSLIGYMISSCNPPTSAQFASLLLNINVPYLTPNGTTTTFTDPWGNTWTYNQVQIPNNRALSFSDPASYLGNTPYNSFAPPYTMTAPALNPNNISFNTSPMLRSQLFAVYPNLQTSCP